jgi:outer membrane receptor protein involved in Fe transport
MVRAAQTLFRHSLVSRMRSMSFLLAMLMFTHQQGLAGTTGTISGTVLDSDGNPVVAATIRVEGTRFGAYSDAEGNFSILNVAPGTYEVRVQRLGYQNKRFVDIVVSADRNTRISAQLVEEAVQTEEVVVVAEKPPVDLGITSSRATVTTEQIESLPVQTLEDVVNLQAGVVEGHFRGGRLGEVQYQVDGVSVNNAYDNSVSVSVDRSLLQEVQVISGTFDAEFGQAMSGVVNAVLKEGSPQLTYGGEIYYGGFAFPDEEDRRIANRLNPNDIQNYQFGLSGPLPLPNTVILLSGRRYVYDDYVFGTRRFVPTDRADFEQKIFEGSGDGEHVQLGYTREWSGVAKLTNTSLRNAKLNYQALVNHVEGRRSNYALRFNPDGLTEQNTFSISHGLDWTQTLSEKSVLEFSFRQNLFHYTDWAFEDVFDPRYDAAGPLLGDFNYERGAVVQGVDFGRFEQKTNALVVKSSVLSQLTHEHQLKFGGELQLPRVSFGVPGHLTYTTVAGQETLVRHIDEPPTYPGISTYDPIIAAAFLQEQTNWTDLTLRMGLRLDYFDARAQIPGDLANPANSISGQPTTPAKDTTSKLSLSPRLGVAFPIEDKAAVHVAYGHFRQFPSIGQIFSNSNYDVLAELQAGGIDYGVLGNPDVLPEYTIQYEIGYKQAFGSDLGVEVTTFYKDIRDLIGVEFVETYNGAQYSRLTNVDFGDVMGITVAADHRQLGPFNVALDYTWQQALGNASDPRETAVRAAAGDDPRPRLIPFNWDQRHTFNLTLSTTAADPYRLSAITRIASGQPYTPVIDAGFGQGLQANSGRRPAGVVVDLRAERDLPMKGRRGSVFLRVFNALDSRYFNGAVFNSTGSPYYSRFPVTDAVALEDPTLLYPPRRIELGIRFGSEGW